MKVLANAETQFIMHYARQDLLWLKYHLNASPKNIFCTKVASKIARTASSSHGYKDLVKEICGKDISKKEQQSDWGNPDLSEKQINYAAQDTEYLFEIKEKLWEMLKEKIGRIYLKSVESYSNFSRHGDIWFKLNIFNIISWKLINIKLPQVIDLEIQALKKLRKSISNSFGYAVDAIAKYQSKLSYVE